jgi:protoporphyrinogen oxidase
MPHARCTIIGGGPAGLTAARELANAGWSPLVLEQAPIVGGIARTEEYRGYRFDIGGHRFFTKCPEVEQVWNEVLPEGFISVPRLSRIYYRGRFFQYPLRLGEVIWGLGLVESGLMFLSHLKTLAFPRRPEESLEDWVVNRFGERLYRTFFKTYTEKVWGIPCTKIRADWAAQRIRKLSFFTAVRHALFGGEEVKSLISEFRYPRLGPGQLWEACAQQVLEKDGEVRLETSVKSLRHDGSRITSLEVGHAGESQHLDVEHVISTMPLRKLVEVLDPPPPDEILTAARSLKYRDFLIVVIIIDRDQLFPDNWIYVHAPEVRVGRIQNFKNWSADMVPDKTTTSLGMEYFCSRGDDLWTMDDESLKQLAARELKALGLDGGGKVIDGIVIRQLAAYPVYDEEYQKHLDTLRAYLSRFTNLQTIGRNGMHRYNNQDHSMLCGIYAARNLLGESHDLWEVNTERSYYEEQVLRKEKTPPAGGSVEMASAARTIADAG